MKKDDTPESEALDEHLLELMQSREHPNHLVACAAYLLRHAGHRGYEGMRRPTTIAEFEDLARELAHEADSDTLAEKLTALGEAPHDDPNGTWGVAEGDLLHTYASRQDAEEAIEHDEEREKILAEHYGENLRIRHRRVVAVSYVEGCPVVAEVPS